jgi:DNA-directed RNA polymerase specialized sigma24 family protein
MRELLDRAVQQLPVAYQTVYRLRDLEEQPGPAVQKRLGLSAAAMKSRLHRARALVRRYLDTALAPQKKFS